MRLLQHSINFGKFVPSGGASTSLPTGTLALVRLPETNRPFVLIGNILNQSDVTLTLRVHANPTVNAVNADPGIDSNLTEIAYTKIGNSPTTTIHINDTTGVEENAGGAGITDFTCITLAPRTQAKFWVDTLIFDADGNAMPYFLFYVTDSTDVYAIDGRIDFVHFEGAADIIRTGPSVVS